MSDVLGPNELPAAPIGDRVLLLPDPPKEETDYKIRLPESARFRPNTGLLLAAGLSAKDKLHDNGIETGDSVVWGQFAGVIYEWDHIKTPGKKECAEHQWERVPSPRDRVTAGQCEKCGAVRWTECLILANVDDIQASVGLEKRFRSGSTKVARGKDSEGRTNHFIERNE